VRRYTASTASARDQAAERPAADAGPHEIQLPDRMVILNTRDLRQVLPEYETHFNGNRPHRFLGCTAPPRPLGNAETGDVKVIRRDRLGGVIHEYTGHIGWPSSGTHKHSAPGWPGPRQVAHAGGCTQAAEPPQ
jgi:hypothetical protein